MALRVYNTLTRTKEDFEPLSPPNVGMYLCGPTVYKYSHIGHMVGPVIFDAVKRYLSYRGYKVTFVINITDIDDKIIVEAHKIDTTTDELTQRITKDYFENLQKLNVEVDHFPKVSDHIDDVLEMTSTLIDKGFAYELEGDVYFEVKKSPDYGKLSNRKLDELLSGVRKEADDRKRHPGDFAMWKSAKPGEPAWESPWGPGRPGWHIECSAMSRKILGDTFDIHGGGLDLTFPHHEDEIAQSECCNGKAYVKYWMHNGLMQAHTTSCFTEGNDPENREKQMESKISKSSGSQPFHELLEKFPAETIRFFVLSTQYRRPIAYSEERIQEVAKGLGKLHTLAERIEPILGVSFYTMMAPIEYGAVPFDTSSHPLLGEVTDIRQRFLDAMDDDFNTGGAVGLLFEIATAINRFLANADEKDGLVKDTLTSAMTVVRELTQILGVLKEPRPEETMDLSALGADDLVKPLADLHLDVRTQARSSKNFALSDMIRDQLAEVGIAITDGPQGSEWTVKDGSSLDETISQRLIEQHLAVRAHARKEKNFALGDRIRDELAGLGIAIADGPQGSTWSLTKDN